MSLSRPFLCLALGAGVTLPARAVPPVSSVPTQPALAVPVSHVRFLHVSPDAPPMTVVVDGRTVVPRLLYGRETPFEPLAGGMHRLQLMGAEPAAQRPLLTETLRLYGGTSYVVAAIGLLRQIHSAVAIVSSAHPRHHAFVRFANYAPGSPVLTITTPGLGRLFYASYAYTTPYISLPVRRYDFSVHRLGQASLVRYLPGITLQAGHVYTLYAIGAFNIGGGRGQPFGALLSDDTTGTTQ